MPALPFVVVPYVAGPPTLQNSGGTDAATGPFSHLSEFDTVGMVWRRTGHGGGVDIIGDLGSQKDIDFFSILQANATPSTTFVLRLANTTTAITSGPMVYSSPTTNFISPAMTREDGLYNCHLEIAAPVSARYWRLSMSNLPDPFEASMMVIGKKITPATFYSPGWEQGVADLGDLDIGRYGIADETPGRVFRTLAFQLGWLSESDFETKFRPLLEKLGKRRPALWCFDPTPNVYRQARTYFGWLKESPAARHVATTPDGPRFAKDLEILSMI